MEKILTNANKGSMLIMNFKIKNGDDNIEKYE